ncbi:1-acylglycerol-3-phosphate O-acyltransferases [Streptococcus gallolyticus]|uniref:1-acylglycerol-3-phosphate O-acyltransferases n=1 Tax=Streptococcus gallolyticus TaxID=315405 RepID=A0AA94S8Z0_9STRE|nr:lysophospholipid acyltransferase family protein [Streptococcus gallolyticus]AQP41291.1 phospho-beta-glycosidase [Streptococcus gallolyticus subsp. gallolyticus DSM 16831]SQG78570.1 1-acylglycerol-3-phosphate O-acyltransferases [Streptococcus gallolyticus]
MMIGGSKRAVIENMKQALLASDQHAKVELGDPDLTAYERQQLVDDFFANQNKPLFKLQRSLTRWAANLLSRSLNNKTKFIGLDNLATVKGGAIVTSNHFNPLENTAIRTAALKTGHKHLYIVSQEINLIETGFLGSLVRHYDLLPVMINGNNPTYMAHTFPEKLADVLGQNELVLIYPEQEMWYNYRKPRFLQRGAYFYAAKNQVPIVPCFVEIRDYDKIENDEFLAIQFVVHIMPAIYPTPDKSVRENSQILMQADYEAKKAAYERAYQKPLTYDFEVGDIAGWRDETIYQKESENYGAKANPI